MLCLLSRQFASLYYPWFPIVSRHGDEKGAAPRSTLPFRLHTTRLRGLTIKNCGSGPKLVMFQIRNVPSVSGRTSAPTHQRPHLRQSVLVRSLTRSSWHLHWGEAFPTAGIRTSCPVGPTARRALIGPESSMKCIGGSGSLDTVLPPGTVQSGASSSATVRPGAPSASPPRQIGIGLEVWTAERCVRFSFRRS